MKVALQIAAKKKPKKPVNSRESMLRDRGEGRDGASRGGRAAEARVVVRRLRVLRPTSTRGVLPRPAPRALPHGRAIIIVQALPAAGAVERPPILGHVLRIIILPPMDRTEERFVGTERPARVEAAPDMITALT